MGLIDELLSKSTGLKSLLGDQMDTTMSKDSLGGSGRSYDPNQTPISQQDFYKNKADLLKQRSSQISESMKPEPFDPNKIGNDNRGYDINRPDKKIAPEGGIVPPEKPDDLSQLDPSLFVKIFGRTKESMAKEWKNKGGFEGLMANPGFTLGLALMQSSAQGKPIGEGVFNAAIKSGAISAQYAERIKARSAVLGPITAEQRDMVRSVLAESDLAETADVSTKIKNFFKGKNTTALNRRALDDVANKALKLVEKETRQKGGQKVRLDRRHIEAAIKELKKEGKIDYSEKGFFNFFGRGIQSTAKPLAKGGPVAAGKDYIVGEEGPEMFVSETNGTIINNDDSKVISMLLESNPQLKNVSKARAVKILKARFPDYF